jgi:hypothetical protein
MRIDGVISDFVSSKKRMSRMRNFSKKTAVSARVRTGDPECVRLM